MRARESDFSCTKPTGGTSPPVLLSQLVLLPNRKHKNKFSSSPLKSYLQIHESDYACHTIAFSISRDFHSQMKLLLAWSIRGDRRRSPYFPSLLCCRYLSTRPPWQPCSPSLHPTGERNAPRSVRGGVETATRSLLRWTHAMVWTSDHNGSGERMRQLR
jgi:hypothetical protein